MLWGMSELKSTLWWITVIAIFIVPFIVFVVPGSMFFPFITGKNFMFRIVVEVMVTCWAILAYMDHAYRPRFTYILGAAGAFLGILTLADLLGENPYRSFWSNYERMEGLITHAHLFLYFLVAGSLSMSEKMWGWVLKTSLGASILVCLHAFQQLAGMADIHQSATRLDASLGNATYLAIYGLFHAFFGAYLFFREKSNPFKWGYLVISVLNLVVVYYTQTRGSIVGLLLGAATTFFLIALFDKDEKGAAKYRKHALVALVGIVALVGVFYAVRDSEFVKNSNTLNRLAHISLNDGTVQSRFLIWNMSWQGFKERPILGWGQDNFIYVFAKHFDPRMWAQEPWFDRSHNVFFDWLIAAGALGLLAYLSLFGSLLWLIWFGKHDLSVIERSILMGMLVTYFIHNVFVFDNLISYILFFTVLAYIHTMVTREQSDRKSEKEKWTPTPEGVAAVSIIAAVLFVFVLYTANIANIQANRGLINGLRNPITRSLDGTIEIALKKVIDRGGFGNGEAREQLGQIALQAQDPKIDQSVRDKIVSIALAELEDEAKNDPNNLRTQFFLGTFYERYQQYDKALTTLNHAIALSPKRQLTLIQMGILHLNRGDNASAREVFKTAYELDTRYSEAASFYIISLLATGDNVKADEILASIKGSERWDNRLVLGYARAKRFDVVVRLLTEKSESELADGQTYVALAGAYNEMKDKTKAIETLKKGIEKFPDIKNTAEGMIQDIQKGVPMGS
jgi:O-antigen ligase/tetratricopeptide (TPR) repeat protein